MSILLIPLSFNFVDALCIATVLGFLSEAGTKCLSWYGTINNNVVVSADHNLRSPRYERYSQRRLIMDDQSTTRETDSVATQRPGSLLDFSVTNGKTMPFNKNAGSNKTPSRGQLPGDRPRDGSRRTVNMNQQPLSISSGEEAVSLGPRKPGRVILEEKRTPSSPLSDLGDEVPHGTIGLVSSSKPTSNSVSIRQAATLASGDIDMMERETAAGGRGNAVEKTTNPFESHGDEPRGVHWGLAVVVSLELILKVIRDET